MPRIFNRTFTALLLTFAYVLLLVHNLVPHHHQADDAASHHHAAADHPHEHHHQHHAEHQHGHSHEPAAGGDADADKPIADPNPFLSDHQHPFADNKVHHVGLQPGSKSAQKQAFPALAYLQCCQYRVIRLPGKIPDPPAYSFPPNPNSCRPHALRGPPVA